MNKYLIPSLFLLACGLATSAFALKPATQTPAGPSLAPVTRMVNASLGQKATFTVPGYRGELDVVDVVLLDVQVGHSMNWGLENLTPEAVGVVDASLYIAHRFEAPSGMTLNQPSFSTMGASSSLAAFDGTVDLPLPAGPSGYWGAPGASLTEWNFPSLVLFGASALDWDKPRVAIRYAPWSQWSYASEVPSGHWARWYDEISGQVDAIGLIRYHLSDNSEVTMRMDGTVVEIE